MRPVSTTKTLRIRAIWARANAKGAERYAFAPGVESSGLHNLAQGPSGQAPRATDLGRTSRSSYPDATKVSGLANRRTSSSAIVVSTNSNRAANAE